MREGDTTEFSRLKTVSKFDEGGSSTVAMDMSRTQGLAMFSPPSLFVESLLEQLCKLFEKDPIRQRELYLTICQQLHKMNLIDESYKIDELQYMRSHYQKALYHYLSVAKSTLVENKAIFPASSKLSLRSEDVLEWSRYSTEFRELKFIAKGGFGHVYKSQNLLDGGTYAIKKLFLSYRSISGFLQKLREVKMLAKLNHPNIVAYKAAWLEPLETKSARSKKNVPAISEPKMKTSNGDSLEVVFEHSSREESVESQQESHDDKSSSFMTSFSESRSSLSTPFSSDSTGTSNNRIICKYKCKERREQQYRFTYTSMAGQQSNCAILFIQMQLCQTTLRQWLDARNQLPPNKEEISPVLFNIQESLDIFKHIVRGIKYIHSQGIVHHDIKPSNIFVSEDLKHVQVGDFGLSCCLLAHSSSGSTSPLMSENGYAQHQLGQYGGTKLYAAPEQMKNLCHPKSDIYSLGIVLLELIKPFQTAMERSKVLSQLKSGQVPSDVGSSWPHLALIIRRMVSGRLEKRPTASELLAELEESEKVNAAQLIEHQKDIIKILTQENVDIRRQNVEKDEEIASLRRRLEDIMSRFDLNVETK